MFWNQLLVIAVLVSGPQSGCSCDPIGSQSYSLGPADVDVGAMHVLRAGPERLVLLKRAIGTDDIHVYVSRDGMAWHKAGPKQQLALDHLVVSSGTYGSKGVLYRLLKSGSVLERSEDGGLGWTRAKLLFPGRSSEDKAQPKGVRITVVGANGLRLYGRARGFYSQDIPVSGIYVSNDGGDRWQLFSTDLVVGTTVAEHEGLILGVSTAGVVESRDNGRTWAAAEIAQKLPTSLPLRDAQAAPVGRRQKKLEVYQMEFPQTHPDSVFLVTNGGLFITHDEGKNWCVATFGSDVLYTVSSVALVNESGSHLLATTVERAGAVLWESKDGGQSFRRIPVQE